MKLIGWTSFSSPCQGICVQDRETLLAALNEMVAVIQEKGYVFSGETHQCADRCVPVFDNGKCIRSSMRAWAMLMAIAHDNDNKQYMNYYMAYSMDEEKIPEDEVDESQFVMTPDDGGFPYYYANQDLQMVGEAVQADMQLMTFDKVVLALYDELKQRMKKD